MTETQVKRPAHEMILQKLKELVEGFKDDEDTHSYFSKLGAIAILLDVLGNMLIPEKEHENVLAEIQQLGSRWKELSLPAPNIPQELYDVLSRG